MTIARSSNLRSVALPTEHGGWSLTLEPVVLGLLVMPAPAGVALGVGALVAFLLRTPLKLALVDRRRNRRLDRTLLARRVAGTEFVALGLALISAWALAEGAFWWPLAAAAPLVAVEVWYDIRSRSRRLIPELAGSVGVAAVAAAIVLAGGGADRLAAGMWCVAAARAVAAITFVRVQLRRAKSQAHRRVLTDFAQLGTAAVVTGAWLTGIVPGAGAIAISGLAIVQMALMRRPVPSTPVIGAQQVVLGLAVVVTTGLGALAP